MKVRLRLSVLLSCLVLALPSMSSVSYPQTRNAQTQTSITESNLLAITNSIDKAARNRNIAGIVGPMAKDVKIDLYETLTIPQGTLRGVTAETTIFNLRNGRIVITSVEGRMRFY